MSSETIRERFERKYQPVTESGCWIWTAGMYSSGYGAIQIGTNRHRKADRAHRVSYQLFKGVIPEGMCVCHKCDVACCVNPDHLFLGTRADNNRDYIAKGRKRGPISRPSGLRYKTSLSDVERSRMRQMISEGMSMRAVARVLGRCKKTIFNACRYERYN